ncbi:hypothetical protein NL676_004211 [Syzygium grande]|nr:hypothetical protein NL676_004211 [Syzygium grande]
MEILLLPITPQIRRGDLAYQHFALKPTLEPAPGELPSRPRRIGETCVGVGTPSLPHPRRRLAGRNFALNLRPTGSERNRTASGCSVHSGYEPNRRLQPRAISISQVSPSSE